MGEIPRSRDAKHPILRQILTPFYRTRMGKAQRRTAATKDNVAKVRRARSERAYVKRMKKDGTLK